MKIFNLDFFKLFLIIILIWIGYSINKYSKNGRYQNIEGGVIDTRTGKLYLPERLNNLELFEIDVTKK